LRLLITGAAGRIGTAFIERYGSLYDLVLTDRAYPPGSIASAGRWIIGDASDPDLLWRLTEGVEAVLHLAADPSTQASVPSLVVNNLAVTAYLFDAAHRRGVGRFVFASSVQTVVGYPPDVPVTPGMPPRPLNHYAATKCFGEALCHVYGSRGMSCIAVRIGAFSDPSRLETETFPDFFRLFVSKDDLCQLLHLCLQAPRELTFAIVHGISDNREPRLDLESTRRLLGYEPRDGAPAPPSGEG